MIRRPFVRVLVSSAFFLLACLLSTGAAPSQTELATLAPKLQPYVDNHVMAGAVFLVADKERILCLDAVGYSDLKTSKPMQVDDLFWIASMSKPITAAALMMLVDEGRIKLDDAVEKYIPEFRNMKVAQADGSLVTPNHPIQIREILSHTSGMGFLNKKDRKIIDSVPLRSSIANDLLEPLHSHPGTEYLYSNEGIDTAGRIIELVSGMPFEKFLQTRLFTPLGMTDTTFYPTATRLQRLAKSYRATADKSGLDEAPIHYLTYPLDGSNRHPAPGGGLFSTARDVCRFCQMLLNGGAFEGKQYLSAESVRKMTTKQTGPLVSAQYGFGLGATDGGAYGHGGAFKTTMNVNHGLVLVFLVQQASSWSAGDPNKDFTTAIESMNPENKTPTPAPAGDVIR